MRLHRVLGVTILAIAVTRSSSAADFGNQQSASERATLPAQGTFPSLAGATTWLNSPPLTPDALQGKVVLVDFLTYTCINWQRTQPYVRFWAEKYKDNGLVVIGV